MRFHRTHKTDGKLLNAGPGVLTADASTGGTIITPPTGTVTMALRDFYRDPTHPADPVVQRKAGTTAANVTVYYDFTGNPPTQPQGKVTQGGTTIIDWTNLTGVVNHTLDGFGVLANVPQGAGYLLHVRDGLQPGNAPTTSDGTHTWGVGVIVLLVGTTNMDRIAGGGATTSVVPGSALTEANYYTGTPVHGSLFDEFGWHAPNAATNYGPFSGAVFALMRILTAELQTLYTTAVPVGVVAWTAVPSNGLAAFTGPAGAQYLLTIAANGTASGGIGMGSPGNYYGGDFEIILAHHGEADSADTATIYQQKLTAFYASMLATVLPFGRGANNLYYGLCLPGGYSALPTMETIRQTVLTYQRAAVASGQPHVDLACDCLDLANDGTYLNTAAGQLRAMHRLLQGALQFLGCSTVGASGPQLGIPSLSGLVATFSVVQDGGTALELQSGGAITGFTANTAADFSGTTLTPTVALVTSNTQIALTFPGGTTFPVYVQYLAGGNPSLVNPIFDNTNYPTGTTGTDVEAVGFPLQPTTAVQRVSNSGISARVTLAGVTTLYDPASPAGSYNPDQTVDGAFDMGDFTDPEGQFVQGNILVRHKVNPTLRLYFRHNKTGSLSHDSVIFEHSDPWSKNPTRLAYTADIYNGTTLLAHYDLTGANNLQHAWGSRWRHKTSDFPIRHDKTWLENNKHVMYTDKTWFGVAPYYSPVSTCLPQTHPMDFTGITSAAGSPGERNEIGPIDGWSAQYILGLDTEASLRAVAEKHAAAYPQYWRDPATGKMLDIVTNWPLASTYAISTQNLGANPKIIVNYAAGTGPATIINVTDDTGHSGNMTFVPYLVTGDPYFLENAQFHANSLRLLNPIPIQGFNAGGRYWTWQLREQAYAAHLTTATTPAPWLLPKSYFDGVIEGFRAKYQSTIDAADPTDVLWASYQQGSGPDYSIGVHPGSYCTQWQISFVTWMTGWLTLQGYDLFKPMFHLNAMMAESLASPVHDYVRGWGVLYNCSFAPSAEMVSAVSPVLFRAQIGVQMVASQSGTTLTVTSITNGPLVVGQNVIYDLNPNVVGSKIVAFLTGGGGVGTYQLAASRTLTSRAMWASSNIMLVQSVSAGAITVGAQPATLTDLTTQISLGSNNPVKETAATVKTPPTVATGTGGVGTYVMTNADSTSMQDMCMCVDVTTAMDPPFFIQTESNAGWASSTIATITFGPTSKETVTLVPATGPQGQIGFTVTARAVGAARKTWKRGGANGVFVGPTFSSKAAACDYLEIIAQFPQINIYQGDWECIRAGRNYDTLFHAKQQGYQTYERGGLALASRAEFGPGGSRATFDATEYAKLQAAFAYYESQFRTYRVGGGYPGVYAKWMMYPSLPIS